MTGFTIPERWQLPPAALHVSMVEMARDGVRRCEGVALWLGRRDGEVAQITHVVALRGAGVVRHPDYLAISPELLNDVTDVAMERGVFLVGQIHSHPPGCSVDLSEPDRRFGINAPGYLSAVAPNFAARADTPASACGFHVFEQGRWRRFSAQELAQKIELKGDLAAPLVVVGGSVDDR